MSRPISSLVCALAVSLAAGGLAAADPVRAAGGNPAPQTEKTDGEKRLQHRDRHRRDWRDYRRDRRYDRRHHRHHYRDHYRDRDRWAHHGRYRYAQTPCWHERRYGRYHGRPALVSVRICQDIHGRAYVDYRSQRLIHYTAPYGHHRRR